MSAQDKRDWLWWLLYGWGYRLIAAVWLLGVAALGAWVLLGGGR